MLDEAAIPLGQSDGKGEGGERRQGKAAISPSLLPSSFRVLSPSLGAVPWAAKCHLQFPSRTSARSWRRGGRGLISALSSVLNQMCHFSAWLHTL